MKRLLFFLSNLLIPLSILAQTEPFVATDLTAENVFTENIEGPNVDRYDNLFVVNYQKDGTIGQVAKDGTVSLYVTLPYESVANAIMWDADGNMLLADWKGHNILKVNTKNRRVSVLVHYRGFNQPNDITVNKNDQIFASDPNWTEGTGNLWRIDPDKKITNLADNMGTTNGIELSPDEKILYVNESVQRKVWAFDVDDKGNISNKRLIIEFPDFGMDGMKCDLKGNLYITRHGKGTVAVVSPGGKLIREIQMKGKKTSNIIFGGTNGKTCYVTLQDRKCVEMFTSEIAGKKWAKEE
ncbi:MAG TPA: SMP-30/gluconolactonase/LRE family protein [Cyclobacteriaceae bacterium]|nr:SMP-30/gluconolactonase/LRE family protein [Cyclobacteriaceae bacterium]